MKKKAAATMDYGVWIDQKKAIIGYFDKDGNFNHRTVYSGIETRVRFPGETTDKVKVTTFISNRQFHKQNKLHNQMLAFCNKVKRLLNNMNAVLIMGPSDAKHKLAQVLKKDKTLQQVWVRTMPADKMTLAEFKKTIMTHYA